MNYIQIGSLCRMAGLSYSLYSKLIIRANSKTYTNIIQKQKKGRIGWLYYQQNSQHSVEFLVFFVKTTWR